MLEARCVRRMTCSVPPGLRGVKGTKKSDIHVCLVMSRTLSLAVLPISARFAGSPSSKEKSGGRIP